MAQHRYHHGDLRRALLAAATEAIEEKGPAALSLRELARRAGVSHAAPAHHFGDKAGLLTALAAEGFELLAAALHDAGDDFLEIGVAYVRFAVDHRAHFEVMFRPDLYRADEETVAAARKQARDALFAGLARFQATRPATASGGDEDDTAATGLAAWAIAHGFATLWLGGALPAQLGDDPEVAARRVVGRLFDG